jgi:hypothetical protein
VTEFGTGRDKYRSRRNRARVRDLFWREWDPICINDLDAPPNEYDRYADKAYVMLMHEGRSAEEIADYLYFISSQHMGLGTNQRSNQRLRELASLMAQRLAALKPTFESESNEPF